MWNNTCATIFRPLVPTAIARRGNNVSSRRYLECITTIAPVPTPYRYQHPRRSIIAPEIYGGGGTEFYLIAYGPLSRLQKTQRNRMDSKGSKAAFKNHPIYQVFTSDYIIAMWSEVMDSSHELQHMEQMRLGGDSEHSSMEMACGLIQR